MGEEPPTVIGLGVTSAPLHGVAYPSLFAAVDKTIAMPWLIQNVKQSESRLKLMKKKVRWCSVNWVATHVQVISSVSSLSARIHFELNFLNGQPAPVHAWNGGHHIRWPQMYLLS